MAWAVIAAAPGLAAEPNPLFPAAASEGVIPNPLFPADATTASVPNPLFMRAILRPAPIVQAVPSAPYSLADPFEAPYLPPSADLMQLASAFPLAPSGGGAAWNSTTALPGVDPTMLLLFEVHYGDLTLTDGLAAYGSPEDPLIPIGELTRLLELDVDVQPADSRIIGRIGEARRTLLVDLRTGVARNGAREIALSPEDAALSPSEIYLRASAVQRLLPLRLTIDAGGLTMRLATLELLPFENRLLRQNRTRQGSGPGPAEEVMRVETPYRAISPPSFDVALNIGAQTDAPRTPFRYDIRTAADVLGTNFQGYVGSEEDGSPSSARATFERRSLEGDLLGPLNARLVAVGDVFSPAVAIGPRSIGGRGVAVSTVPLDQASIFNRIDLRGELPLGYDVELYVNDVLISGQTAAEQGRYEFLNVPLSPGVNVVRIVTYGPRGERKEDTRIINVSGGLLRKGESTLEFGAVDQNQPLIRFRRFQAFAGREVFARGPRVVAAVNHGVSQYLTLSAAAGSYAPRENLQQDFAVLGARTSLFGFATQAALATNDDGGSGATLAVAGRPFGVSTVLRHSEYRGGFIDENNLAADLMRDVRRRSEITLDGSLPLGGRILPVSLRTFRDEYVDGGSRTVASGRASAAMSGVLYSTGLDYERGSLPGSRASEMLTGYLAASAFQNYRWQLRGSVDYEFLPNPQARNLILTADRRVSEEWALRFGLNQRLDARGSNLFASSIHRTNLGDVALTGEYDNSDQSWRLGVQLNFGLAWRPERERYAVSRPGPGIGGSVVVHAFMDANGDGAFTPGEAPVANVTVEGGERFTATGPDGRAYLTGLGAAANARVMIGVDRIENAMVKAPPGVVEFSPRPGSVTTIEYPIRPTGELAVKIALLRPDGQRVGLSAVQIQLVSERGAVVDGVTEFDGSVIFQDLPVDTYRLRLQPEQAGRLRMRLTKEPVVVIRADGDVTPDVAADVVFDRG